MKSTTRTASVYHLTANIYSHFMIFFFFLNTDNPYWSSRVSCGSSDQRHWWQVVPNQFPEANISFNKALSSKLWLILVNSEYTYRNLHRHTGNFQMERKDLIFQLCSYEIIQCFCWVEYALFKFAVSIGTWQVLLLQDLKINTSKTTLPRLRKQQRSHTLK